MAFEQGPFLSAALICDRILDEKDGVKSIIRITDRVTVTATGSEVPDQIPPFPHKITLFIRFKSGMARGSFNLRVNLIKPSGESLHPFRRSIHFEGEEDRGVDIVINSKITLDMAGLHWFEIRLNEERLTSVPFRVIYSPQFS